MQIIGARRQHIETSRHVEMNRIGGYILVRSNYTRFAFRRNPGHVCFVARVVFSRAEQSTAKPSSSLCRAKTFAPDLPNSGSAAVCMRLRYAVLL